MKIEFTGKTKAIISDIDIQSLKKGQTDVVPAVCLTLKATLANSTLAMLDASLQSFLFEKGMPADSSQQVLDGIPVVSDMPKLTDAAVALGALTWGGEQTGATIKIYQGVTGDEDITLRDCTVRKVKFEPIEGGAVEWKFEAYTSDVDEHTIGALGVLKSLTRDIELTPAQPVDDQRDIEDDDGDAPEAGQIFAASFSMGG